ncbi:PREDICTED: cellular nucleic acid-binding protein homolog [Trachymyrmex cornetzi]|uniref:cellular nucleic acid-binding protein homolog n=1 Tax=Trachymyrmex cornetzi TaxID=471704 RepID=UPI00084EEB0E|nr:PREDICTED: cellular nucleic acid-binding protein homolog [Trachymyrmex cornetzi]
MGEITRTPNGLGTAWLRCPLLSARAVTCTPRLRICWTMVRVEMIPTRALQCFRCLEQGHVTAECKANVDRSSNCYRCGREGHLARTCAVPVHCVICADRGVRADHRMEGKACKPPS